MSKYKLIIEKSFGSDEWTQNNMQGLNPYVEKLQTINIYLERINNEIHNNIQL